MFCCPCAAWPRARRWCHRPGQVPPASAHAAAGVRYVDITESAGLSRFTHVSGSPEKNYLIETTGSGVGVLDYDNDGLLDIYLVNGSSLDRVRSRAPAPRAALFRNTGSGTFTDVTEKAGVANERWGQGVCAGDIDNDGDADLYVTNFGVSRLYRNERGVFTDIAPAAGVAVDSWSTGCAFGDYDGDGWLDLYVAGYVALDVDHLPPAPGARIPPPTAATAASPDAAPPASTRAGGMGASYSAGATVCTYSE